MTFSKDIEELKARIQELETEVKQSKEETVSERNEGEGLLIVPKQKFTWQNMEMAVFLKSNQPFILRFQASQKMSVHFVADTIANCAF